MEETRLSELSPTAKLMQRNKEMFSFSQNKRSSIIKEFEKYESFSLAKKETDLLTLWKNHELILPLLAQIAKRIYTVPVSSAPSERAISAGGLVVTPKKNRLAPKKVENLVLIKLNKDRIENFKRNSGYSTKRTKA